MSRIKLWVTLSNINEYRSVGFVVWFEIVFADKTLLIGKYRHAFHHYPSTAPRLSERTQPLVDGSGVSKKLKINL